MKNLLDRLNACREQVLALIYDFFLPPENDLAKRDLRRMKMEQKILGSFRREEGARALSRIRRCTSTVRKEG